MGSRSFFTPGGRNDRVILIGIWVSTRDLSEVGWTVSCGRTPSAEFTVEGGEEMAFSNEEGVALDSGSNVKPAPGNCKFGENVIFPGESPFMLM